MIVTATGSDTGRTLADWFGEIVNVKDFDAKGDNSTDDTASINAAIARANSLVSSGNGAVLYFPFGRYVCSSALTALSRGVCIRGAGRWHTIIRLTTDYSGPVFSWSESWMSAQFSSDTVDIANLKVGAGVYDLAIVGDRDTSNQQDGLIFYDRCDLVEVLSVDFFNLKGSAIRSGELSASTEGYMRESWFDHIRAFRCGTSGAPAVEFSSYGSTIASNEIDIGCLEIYAPQGDGFVIRNDSSGSGAARDFRIDQLRVEGDEAGGISGDLLRLGESSMKGVVRSISFGQLKLINPYEGYSAFRITSDTGAHGPYFISIAQGEIGSSNGEAADGVTIETGRDSIFNFADISVDGNEVVIGANVSSGLEFFGDTGNSQGWTWSVNAATKKSIQFPVRRIGQDGNGSVQAIPHDGSSAGGNTPGAGAVDLQIVRTSAGQAATASYAVIAGGNSNTANGIAAAVGGGFSNAAGGDYSAAPGGRQGSAGGRYGVLFWASGLFDAQGDAQGTLSVLRGTGSDENAIRLTADAAAAGTANIDNLPNNASFGVRITLMATNVDTRGTDYFWCASALVSRDANAASTAVAVGTPEILSRGTVSGASVSLTADTTNGGLNLSFTPPTSNAETWRVVARIEAAEVN